MTLGDAEVRTGTTVMFVDIVGSILTKNADYDAAVDLATHHASTVSWIIDEVCAEHRTVAERKLLGDGVMCWFAAMAPAAVLQAAYRIVGELGDYTTGSGVKLNTGVAIATGGPLYVRTAGDGTDVHGPAIDRSARMVLMARPRQILLDGHFAKALGPSLPPLADDAVTYPARSDVREARIGAIAERVEVHVVQVDGDVPPHLYNATARAQEINELRIALMTMMSVVDELQNALGTVAKQPDAGVWRGFTYQVEALRQFLGTPGPYARVSDLVAAAEELRDMKGLVDDLGHALQDLEELVGDSEVGSDILHGISEKRQSHITHVSKLIGDLQARTKTAIKACSEYARRERQDA
jgi:class 3 adenylate cyclase